MKLSHWQTDSLTDFPLCAKQSVPFFCSLLERTFNCSCGVKQKLLLTNPNKKKDLPWNWKKREKMKENRNFKTIWQNSFIVDDVLVRYYNELWQRWLGCWLVPKAVPFGLSPLRATFYKRHFFIDKWKVCTKPYSWHLSRFGHFNYSPNWLSEVCQVNQQQWV